MLLVLYIAVTVHAVVVENLGYQKLDSYVRE